MQVRLVNIIPSAWETKHRVRALEVDGRSLAVAALADLVGHHQDDYKKVMRVLRLLAGNERVRNENHVKRARDYPDIYEVRGGKARLFFFYTPGRDGIVVCTNAYWKTKPSTSEQDAAFAMCGRLRQLYLEYTA